jgi:hypothetical protein
LFVFVLRLSHKVRTMVAGGAASPLRASQPPVRLKFLLARKGERRFSDTRLHHSNPDFQYTPTMRSRPRIRRTIKWTAAAATVLLVVAWIGSGRVAMRYPKGWASEQGLRCRIFPGAFVLGHIDMWRSNYYPAIDEDTMSSKAWRPQWAAISSQWTFSLPLWIPCISSFVATGAVWRIDSSARRRAKLNLCPKCHYDRTGLARDAKCPECGAVPSSN